MDYTIDYRIYVGVDNTAMETLVEEVRDDDYGMTKYSYTQVARTSSPGHCFRWSSSLHATAVLSSIRVIPLLEGGGDNPHLEI